MVPFGPFYPLILQAVMNHAERLVDLLLERERLLGHFETGAVWLIGRATELQCVAAMAVVDWQEGRLTPEAAAGKLARYVRELHDGLAMHMDIEMPACCRPLSQTLASDGPAIAAGWRPARPGLARGTVATREARNRTGT